MQPTGRRSGQPNENASVRAFRERFEDFLSKPHFTYKRFQPGTFNSYLLAVLLIVVATVSRLAAGDSLEGVQFITMFPAVIATTLICGARVGFFGLVLATVCSWYFLIPPAFSFKIGSIQHFYALLTFVFVGGLITVVLVAFRFSLERASRLGGRLLAINQTMAMLFESNPDGILLVDREGRITTVNRRTTELFGKSSEALIGATIDDLLPERFRERHTAHLSAYRANPHARAMGSGLDLYGLRDDGAEIPVGIQIAPVTINDELQTIATIRDLSEYKALQKALAEVHEQQAVLEERQRGAAELARSNAELEEMRVQNLASRYARSLLEACLDPMVTISPEGKITDVNEATSRITGVSRTELVGTDFCDYFTDPKRAREGYQLAFAEGSIMDYKLTIRHRNDSQTEVTYNASVYRDATGHVLGVFAAARDMTAQRKVEVELAEQRIKDAERMVELELFQRLTIGRELKMIELKNSIAELQRINADAAAGR